jgi:acyl dehydratase
LRVRVTVTSVRASASKPDRGIVLSRLETLNQNAEVVLHITMPFFVLRQRQ